MSDTPSTALVPVEQRAALALGSTETEIHLRELATKHSNIVEIKDKNGRDQAHGAAMELKRARTHIEKVSKEARDDATKFSKAVIAEEKRLVDIIDAEEKRLFAIRDSWDAEQERIRQEKVLAELLRLERINAAIASIAAIPSNLVNANSGAIAQAMTELGEMAITEEAYEEFTAKAEHFKQESINKLVELLDAAMDREAEQIRITQERERLEAERAELERERKELEEARARAAAEAAMAAQRALDEANAKAKAEAAQREAFQKQQHDAFEEERAAAQALLEEQQRQIDAEREQIAAQVRAQRVAEEDARRAQEAMERAASEEQERRLTWQVREAVANAFGVEESEAEEFILRAANVITTLKAEELEAA